MKVEINAGLWLSPLLRTFIFNDKLCQSLIMLWFVVVCLYIQWFPCSNIYSSWLIHLNTMIISRILTGGARVGIKNRFNSPQFWARACISKVICRGPFMINELRWDINNARFVHIGGIVDQHYTCLFYWLSIRI